MKITEYPSITELDDNNVFILDGTNGTKKIAKSDLTYALFNSIPEMHNQIFRGKNLGSTYTSAQKAAVYNGTFNDLWVGDYWEISGHKWRIVDIDYFMGYDKGYSYNVDHHLVIMPDKLLMMIEKYCDENTKVAYEKSYANGSGRDAYLNDIIPQTFKQNLFSHAEVLVASVGERGEANRWTQVTNTLQNPTAAQIFGVFAPFDHTTDNQLPQNQSNALTQFSLMKITNKFIRSFWAEGVGKGTPTYILRDPCGFGSSPTALVSNVISDTQKSTYITTFYGNNAYGLRPYVCVSGSL